MPDGVSWVGRYCRAHPVSDKNGRLWLIAFRYAACGLLGVRRGFHGAAIEGGCDHLNEIVREAAEIVAPTDRYAGAMGLEQVVHVECRERDIAVRLESEAGQDRNSESGFDERFDDIDVRTCEH